MHLGVRPMNFNLCRYLFNRWFHLILFLSDLTSSILDKFLDSFNKDPKNNLAQNACTKYDPLEMCLSRKRLEEIHHVFTHKVSLFQPSSALTCLNYLHISCQVDEVKPITNQKSSGRCWIFALLNSMRIPFVKTLSLEEFEFSQSHLFFWDKVFV